MPHSDADAESPPEARSARRVLALLPGLAAAGLVGLVAVALARWTGALLGYERSPLSPVLLAVALGLVIGQVRPPGHRLEPGVRWAMRDLLRIGVALLGIRLSLAAVAGLGALAVPVVVACIVAALVLAKALARLLRLPPRLGWLIAAGTSICGITAIVAAAPVIDADETETSYAVATIALFGMLALLFYPFLAHALFDTPVHAGLFLGSSIHDTSQVVGAAAAYSQQYGAPVALETAVVTKLVRNLSMILVIPVLGLIHRRGSPAAARHGQPIVPLFVLAFLGMSLLRTLGDAGDAAFGVLPEASWLRVVAGVETAAAVALLVAMAAVGLRTRLDSLRTLGLRPLLAGFAAAATVGVVSAASILLLATA